jgi:hypothetical protein
MSKEHQKGKGGAKAWTTKEQDEFLKEKLTEYRVIQSTEHGDYVGFKSRLHAEWEDRWPCQLPSEYVDPEDSTRVVGARAAAMKEVQEKLWKVSRLLS